MTPPRPSPRLLGVDAARGVALLGMTAVHVTPAVDAAGRPSALHLAFGGTASALFALLAGVDVFHAGQEDLTSAQARRVLGPEVLLGRSCRSQEHVRAAAADPELDYFCTGPVWETPTKPGRAAVGLELPRFAAALTAPDGQAPGRVFFAIGGIDQDRVPRVRAAGAERIVVVRAVTGAEDPEAAARALRTALEG